MAWSYSGNPTTTPRDEVRFLIGDTDQTDQLLLDGEIDFILTIHPKQTGATNYTAAASAARAIHAKLARLVDKQVGSLSIQYSRKADAYSQLADDLDTKAYKGATQAPIGAPRLSGGGDQFLQSSDYGGSAGDGPDGSPDAS